MTVKAGQKCTAIRRAFVPVEHVDAVGEAVAAKLADDRGRQPGRRVGRDGRAGQPRAARGGPPLAQGARVAPAGIVFGDPEHVEVVGADAERGAFLSPVLVRADDSRRAEVHEVEAFGPVSTLIGYRDTADVDRAGRARQGQPGRVGRHRRRRLRPRRRARHRARGTAGCSCSTPTPRPSRPATARRCRCSCTAAPDAPAAARSWAACARCSTTCSAPPCRPARACCRRSPAAGCAAPSAPTPAPTRSPSRWPSCASATPSSPARAW